ncbi:MAG: hypothetical protein J0H61_12230 [Alphaproteobacteria bacterium]|nr:hypothetical protein [Alphaproteobacteria bacterium]
MILSGLTPWTPGRLGLIVLLLVNLTLGLSQGALIAWRLVRLWAERKSGRAGARLHVRLVAWFGTIAVVPAILIAIFAAVTLNLGLEAWFSGRVKDALGSAVNVAQHYVKEHERGIIGDAYDIANNIQHDPTLFDADKHVRPAQFFSKLNSLTKDPPSSNSSRIPNRLRPPISPRRERARSWWMPRRKAAPSRP